MTVAVSPWAPFRHRAFFWLWLGVVVSSVGLWAQTVGAQWLFVDDPHAATIVTLVQTATTLPMMLLALPAGVLADAFDRRALMFGVQIYFVAVAILLAVLTAAGSMPPALLLTFTFAIGAGQALLSPTWQALITELVPRAELAAATRLDMISVNVARAAGPALAGVVIARWGVPPVFAITAAAAGILTLVLLAWRRPRVNRGEREPFLPALRAGGRYVRHEPVVRRTLVRFAGFLAPACAVWALLPLIASRQLGLGANGYGLLFAALGLGAVAGALGLGRITQHLSSNAVLALAAIAFGLTFGALALTSSLWAAAPLLVVCGFGWTATVSTVISELQLFLPGWVRARAIAIYLMVFLGTQAVFSPVWGQITQHLGLDTAMFAAAALAGLSAIGALTSPVPDNQHLDRSALSYWIPPPVAHEPKPDAGPIVVSIEYQVAPDQEAPFLAAMAAMRRSRLRSGASRWELYRVGEHPDLFTEQFQVPTWREHQLQHDGRLTAEDQAIEDAAFAHIIGTPRTRHLITPVTARNTSSQRSPDYDT
ncbi:MFS transporter [Actinoplanes friuliensis]|uniref:YkuC-like MFS-type transporter n=1 Tax=Actinoplanes friuliensis DSM 7358 TaxID=1246995 RepID=U5W0P0_9ACTN|nr:MFS transporter [Actinoplanes friuliensis]AGZ42689.1 ykuC-like MFS-type transporter [Actinoplanes friuliensis DSM 7358]